MNIRHRLADALAEIAGLDRVAEFDRLVLTGAGAARDRGAAEGTAEKFDVDFDCGLPRESRISGNGWR